MKKDFGLQSKYLPKNISPIPVFFIKSPFFTPSSKNTNRLQEVRKIKYKNYYGYETVKISGLALNLNLDFKIFSTILKLRDESDENYISIDLIDFAELLGNKRKSVSKSTKNALEESFNRLLSQNVSFIKKDDEGDTKKLLMHNILNEISICFETNEVEIEFNDKVKDIYEKDKYVQFVNMDTFKTIKGEVAKALWLFYEANSKFTSFPVENIKKRLILLQKETKEINRQIKKAHDELLSMGYLSKYEIIKRSTEYKILRHKNKR